MSIDKITALAIQSLIFMDYFMELSFGCDEKVVYCKFCAVSLGLWLYWAILFSSSFLNASAREFFCLLMCRDIEKLVLCQKTCVVPCNLLG